MQTILIDALFAVLVLSGIPMAAISLGAGVIALLQAITQVQEQSLLHLARLLIMVAVLLAAGGHALSLLESIFLKVLSLASFPGGL